MKETNAHSYDFNDIFHQKAPDGIPSEFQWNRDWWDKIEECKEQFLNYDINPYEFSIVREPIAASWIRSKTHCMPSAPLNKIENPLLRKIQQDNKSLIEIAEHIFKSHLSFLYGNPNCNFGLIDRNGITLIVTDYDKETYTGINLSEEAVGTSSHALSIHHAKSIALIGPENYNEMLKDGNLAISFPIYDDEGNAMAVVGAAYYQNKNTILDMEKYGLLSWLVALQQTIVGKIEDEWRSTTKKYRIQIDTDFLQTAMSMSEDCVMAVNNNGQINFASPAVQSFFGFTPNQVKGTHYSDIIGSHPQIANILKNDRTEANFTANITGVNGLKPCIVKATRVIPDNSNLSEGVVILISEHNHNYIIDDKSKNRNLGAFYTFKDIYGDSEEINRAKHLATKFAPTFGNILLIGDSGTGKEMFAQSIHNESCFSRGPFISINCASIPKNLIESELFGYEGGSFTGADRKGRIGKLELANNGTLFLDEIGEMPLELQPVLLRVLEDKRIMRIGGNKYIPIKFRVIAATNKDLLEQTNNHLFREDLYYRLAAFKIVIPPLKNRGSDVIKLAHTFLEEQSIELNLPLPKIDSVATEAILRYSWPGNVRQLKNAMFYALNIAEDGVISIHDLPEEIVNPSFSPPSFSCSGAGVPKTKQELEREGILAAMRYTNNNIRMAAQILNLGKTTLYRKLKEYNIPFDSEVN